ncbi:hypothetical protein MTO96_040208, partial [Rhipicephalus appendiculatus]
ASVLRTLTDFQVAKNAYTDAVVKKLVTHA